MSTPQQHKTSSNNPADTKRFHPRNIHNQSYDFPALIKTLPSLADFVSKNVFGNLAIDYSHAEAVKQLNTALLAHHYEITGWAIPEGALCPPIPGRVDYIHYIADLLEVSTDSSAKPIRMLDIGIGANGIYSLLASQCYGWECVGSDINQASLNNVALILEKNNTLKQRVSLRHQQNSHQIFKDIIKPDEHFNVTVCNPPFHASAEEASKSHQQKQHNLNQKKTTSSLNFGGSADELWCNGGEKLFLKKMIRESQHYSAQCDWFTSLISKNENVAPSMKLMRKLGATAVKEIRMLQGKKVTRVIAWTFR
ncbi:23S rRNA (adenine(1618)-N(6))-methyltransferase RlmF [Methylophaga thalassica]|uniref:23S rRNA (adenine(1618)-N(6))-methyltransferase RlmF n=1 Tax=Methylophaga aminisulfidivorans TaxID=230105 RepID=UPI003A9564FD